MAGLGPRVGGAHVDVNLQFDDKSVGQVGKAIHRQLSQLNKSLVQMGEQNSRVYRAIGRDAVLAWRSLLGTVVTSAPLVGSAISGVAGAATALAGAFYSATQASFGFAPVFLSIGVAAGTAALGMKSFFSALKSGDLSGLTPSAKAAAEAVQGLGSVWKKVREEVQERMFKGLSDDIARLSTTFLPVLQVGLGKMADSLNSLTQEMLNYVNSASGLKTISKFLDNMADIFKRLSRAVVPFLDGFLRLMNALSPAGKRLADRIADVAKRFQSWTKAEGFGKRINDMMLRAEKTAGLLFKVLGNLGSSIANIFNAANPATNTFLQMLVDLTQRFEDWTKSVGGQESIATWATQSVAVMQQFGKTAEAAFKVIAELADPRVIISFLKTLEEAFNYLGKLPLDKIVSAFASLAETLQPVSSLFLAVIIGGAALNIMLGSLLGQFAGLFSVIAKVVKFKILINLLRGTGSAAGGAGAAMAGAAGKTGLLSRAWAGLLGIFARVKSVFASVIGYFTKTGKATTDVASKAGRLSGAFKPVMSTLSRFAKFAGPAGLAIWIGSIISKSDKLKGKFGEIWDAMKEAGSALSGAFKEIGEALSPLAPVAKAVGAALGPVFGFLDKLMGLAIGVVLDSITLAFKSLANVIEGAGSIIAGLINVLMGLFTLDFGKMLDGLKQIVSGIGPLLKGLLGLFVSFFAPARLAKLGLGAIKGLGGGIAKAVPGILSKIGSFIGTVLKFFASLPSKLIGLGGRAFGGLGKAVASNVPKVISAAGRLVSGVLSWIGRLPGRLLSLGQQAIGRLAGAVSTGIGRLRSIASRIFTGIISIISKLPGRLLSLGQQAISRLAGAVSAGIGRLRGIASRIVGAVTGALSSLPGKMLSIGRTIIGSLISGIASGIGKLAGTVGKVASTIGKFLPGSPVKEGPLTAWNRGSGATGGGRNVIDAITAGLRETDPIRKAMQGVASAVSSSLIPTVGAGALAGGGGGGGGGGSVTNSRNLNVTIQNPQPEPASDSLTRTTRNLAYLGLA